MVVTLNSALNKSVAFSGKRKNVADMAKGKDGVYHEVKPSSSAPTYDQAIVKMNHDVKIRRGISAGAKGTLGLSAIMAFFGITNHSCVKPDLSPDAKKDTTTIIKDTTTKKDTTPVVKPDSIPKADTIVTYDTIKTISYTDAQKRQRGFASDLGIMDTTKNKNNIDSINWFEPANDGPSTNKFVGDTVYSKDYDGFGDLGNDRKRVISLKDDSATVFISKESTRLNGKWKDDPLSFVYRLKKDGILPKLVLYVNGKAGESYTPSSLTSIKVTNLATGGTRNLTNVKVVTKAPDVKTTVVKHTTIVQKAKSTVVNTALKAQASMQKSMKNMPAKVVRSRLH